MSAARMGSTKGKRNYFGKEMLALKIFGVSLTADESLRYKMYSFLVLPPTVFLYPVLDILEYFKHDISVVGDIIVYQMATFLNLCKITVVLRNRIKYGNLLAKLEQEPFIPNVERGGRMEEKLAKECVRFTTGQTFIFLGFAYAIMTSTTVFTVVKRLTSDDYRDWLMPYGPLTLFNITYSPNYEINCLYQNFSIIYIASLSVTTDLLLGAVLAHISYQFKILQNVLRLMVENGYKKMLNDLADPQHKLSVKSNAVNDCDGSTIPWKYLKTSITEAVQYHVAIINIAEEIEEVFSFLLLIVFLGTLILLCFSTYAASSAHSQQSAMKHMGEGIVACLQVATVCFWGEQVLVESQLVGNAVYESNFVGTDLRFQKMLAFIIRRSQNPIKMTAAKFADICLTTFAWILRTSYSAFMVLRRAKM